MSIDLETLAALEQAATPGEWELGEGWIYTDPIYEDDNRLASVHKASTFTNLGRQIEEHGRVEANLALIVAMRNALPELMIRLESAQEAADGFKALLEQEHDNAAHWMKSAKSDGAKVELLAQRLDDMTFSRNKNRNRANSAEARVAHLEAGIKVLADTMHGSAMDGRLAVTCSSVRDELRALLNGTEKDGA